MDRRIHQVGRKVGCLRREHINRLVSGGQGFVQAVSEGDLRDRMGTDVVAAVHQNRMGGHQLLTGSGEVGAADRKADVEVVIGDLGEPEAVDEGDHGIPSGGVDHILQSLNRRGVETGRDRIGEGDIAVVYAVGVFDHDIGALIRDRFVGDHMACRPAEILKGQGVVEEGLDARTGLLVLIRRMVQKHRAAAAVVASAADCDNLAVLVVLGDHADFHELIGEDNLFIASRLNVIHDLLHFGIHEGVDIHRHREGILAGNRSRLFNDGIDVGLEGIRLPAAASRSEGIDQCIFYLDRFGEPVFLIGDIAVPYHQ